MPELRLVLRNCGAIDPRNMDSHLAYDGFKALSRALNEMTPEQVVGVIKASGLRGRGGAGFPTGLKWELVGRGIEADKYLICNADEGEMGTFKDRYILSHDPFSLLEGIAIAGYAMGARKAYLYLRHEYTYLLELLQNAVRQIKEKGFLNQGKLNLDIEVRLGAGAYVCGEETALMESIEGKRGEVRYRPPFPPTSGLWQKPTSINNVETLMNVVPILLNGAAWFSGIGTERSKGTKVFSVSGDVQRPAVYEVPMGTPLRELVADLAGGSATKMVQVGGASGRVVPYQNISTPLAFEAVLGAGAVLVLNSSRSAVELAHSNMEFFREESCGKCTPCREGTLALLLILERFAKGRAQARDFAIMDDIASTMMLASLCGLGQAAPNSLVDTLHHFRHEYEACVQEGVTEKVKVEQVR